MDLERRRQGRIPLLERVLHRVSSCALRLKAQHVNSRRTPCGTAAGKRCSQQRRFRPESIVFANGRCALFNGRIDAPGKSSVCRRACLDAPSSSWGKHDGRAHDVYPAACRYPSSYDAAPTAIIPTALSAPVEGSSPSFGSRNCHANAAAAEQPANDKAEQASRGGHDVRTRNWQGGSRQ